MHIVACVGQGIDDAVSVIVYSHLCYIRYSGLSRYLSPRTDLDLIKVTHVAVFPVIINESYRIIHRAVTGPLDGDLIVRTFEQPEYLYSVCTVPFIIVITFICILKGECPERCAGSAVCFCR